jgi:nitric oxide reductase NorQ protein
MKKFDLNQSADIRPSSIIMSDLKWKFLVRTILRGKNLMITGPGGCGKTFAVMSVAKALNRDLFRFNLGATQDPRSTLIGNTHFDKGQGTYFRQSEFVNAIQTPNAVILLDELSRAHPEAWNILMTVIDHTQRYLRIDESPDTPTINVAEGVTFIATANIGIEYTATRVLDRALTDRFMILEMDLLNEEQQFNFLNSNFPNNEEHNKLLASIYASILNESKIENSRISTYFSTRMVLEAASLVTDGFDIQEAAEISIFPFYSDEGGLQSERTYVKQLVQRFIPVSSLNSNIFEESNTQSSPL